MSSTSKADETARRIATVAADLFLEQGFEDTTISQIADAANVATGTVLLHYGSKVELATGAFARQIAETVTGASRSLPDADIVTQLRHIVGTLYEWYDTHASVARVLLQQALFSEGPWAEKYNATVSETVKLFAELVNTHRIAGAIDIDIDPALAGEGILADYLLVLLQGIRGLWPDVESQLDHFVALTKQRLSLT